jgi:hypothetical protein
MKQAENSSGTTRFIGVRSQSAQGNAPPPIDIPKC